MKRRNHQLIFIMALVGLLSACSPQPEQPNIILITLDTQRADFLTPYGFEEGWTPSIAELAEQGTLFESAITTSGTTWPAHGSMMTGLYPRYHGLRSNFQSLEDSHVTLAERLKERGYETGSFVAFKAMQFRGNLSQGFDGLSDPERIKGVDPIRDGQDIVALAKDWLGSQEREAPFFLWMHLFEPHGPYRLNEYSKARLGDYEGMLSEGATMDIILNRKDEMRDNPKELKALADLFAGEVKRGDDLVGELLDKVRSIGELDNSIVIVTADHGEGLGEHGYFGHGASLEEVVLQVPLLVTDLRKEPVVNRQRVKDLVSVVDITPTVLELVDGSLQSGLEEQFQGRSLMAALRGEELPLQTYFSEVEWREPDRVEDWYDPDAIAVYNDDFKYRKRGDRQWFVQLQRPSWEVSPLDETEHAGMLEFLKQSAQAFLSGESTLGKSQLTDEDIENLKSLGYIQ